MVDDTERLIVQLEARITQFEKQMKRAEKAGTKTYNNLQRNSGRATRKMERHMLRSTNVINKSLATTASQIGMFAKGFAPALGAAGLAGTVTALGQVARSVADIGREARRAGIDVEVFQELGYVAEQNRIPIDALTDGIKELQLRADEFIITGTGSGSEAFQRLGIGAEELKEKLKDPRNLFIEIIGKLQQLDKAAQIRISDELFGGTAGERFVELLDAGADKIRDQIQEARNLGIVLDKDVISKAEEVDRKFAIVSRTVGTTLKKAIIEAATALGQFIDKFRAFDQQQTASLDQKLSDLGLSRIDIETKILELKDEQRKLSGALAKAESRNIQGTINTLKTQLDAITSEEAKILEILNNRSSSTKSDVTKFSEVKIEKPKTSAERKRARSIVSTLEERKAISDLIDELQKELLLVGSSDTAKRAHVASRRAGTIATDEERQTIIGLNEAIYKATKAEDEYKKAQQSRYTTLRDELTSLYDDLKRGESFTESLANAFERMGDRIVDTLVNDVTSAISGVKNPSANQTGQFSNILGIFGGFAKSDPWSGLRGFSSGGYTGNIGVKQTAGIVHGKEFVVNARATQKHRGLLEAINNGQTPAMSVPRTPSGRSVVEIRMADNLVGQILAQSRGQALQLAQDVVSTYNKKVMPGEAMKAVQKQYGDGKSFT